jgi:hypothetical protein
MLFKSYFEDPPPKAKALQKGFDDLIIHGPF